MHFGANRDSKNEQVLFDQRDDFFWTMCL